MADRALCWRVDALRTSFKPKGDPPWHPYGVVFFDPPYSMTRNVAPNGPVFAALERLSAPEVTESDAILIVRTSRDAEPQFPPVWRVSEHFEIASMAIYFLGKAGLKEPPQ